jgi:hypothetical protein
MTLREALSRERPRLWSKFRLWPGCGLAVRWCHHRSTEGREPLTEPLADVAVSDLLRSVAGAAQQRVNPVDVEGPIGAGRRECGAGVVLTFGLAGGYEAGIKVDESVRLISHLANIGACRSLIILLPRPRTASSRPNTGGDRRGTGCGATLDRPGEWRRHHRRS